ncbi:MAG TPA: prolyl oligopeptidase family serine peptidase [Candidatus Acidoferrales bacterium]|nr:prolyl oligopeptidase family serine peptidase [Candidatus Acidoferrales bacterium]
MHHRTRILDFAAISILATALAGELTLRAQTIPPRYEKPSPAILSVLDAPPPPEMRVSPSGDAALLYTPELYPSIYDLSRPMLRLAGLRMNPANNGAHNPPRFTGFALVRLPGGSQMKLALPAAGHFSAPIWAPDSAHFFTVDSGPRAVQLWIGDGRTGAVRVVAGIRLNATLGEPCRWMPGSRDLLCATVPAGRGAPPREPDEPAGPRVQQSFGKAAPQPTFEDLLQNNYDQQLFDYYATAQLELVRVAGGPAAPVGKPAIFGDFDPAPDGRHILVERIHRPYSYLVTVGSFPREVDVWTRAGRVAYHAASLPLEENVPLAGVPTGPRDFSWEPTAPATLVWVEALDGGNPRTKAAHRDKVMRVNVAQAQPGGAEPAPVEMFQLEQRFAGIAWGERGDFGIVLDFDRSHQRGRAFFFDPGDASAGLKLVWDRSLEDRYKDPGQPVERLLPGGHRAIVEDGDFIFLAGAGASPEGDRPFLDRFNRQTLRAERVFHCSADSYESFVALDAADGSKFVTRRESPSDPPNYFLRDASGASRQLSHYADPAPQLRKIKWQEVTYQRDDGVGLSMTLYLPPDYRPGERRPAVVWAYPREYVNAAVASEVAGSPNRFLTLRGYSELFFLLDGYAVLDNAAMPVVGNPETVNDTYVQQIVADAKAAIDKAAAMGAIDPGRVGVGGHSYGAFMTGNLLAHSDLFRAGIAESGAYNRTLTPFGFQNERRTLWQAPQTYLHMSPFMYADKIKAPILLIHGEADNNSGTFPIQSDRLYRAIKGNGGSVRYVTLPDEAHGYAARETIEDVLWEKLRWFDMWVKNPGAPETPAGGRN